MRFTRAARPRRPGVLILVENLAVPFDRRVWQEACALRDAGYDVSVVCPRSARHPARKEQIDGISVHRYPPGFEARGMLGWLVEYGVALTWQTLLAWRIALTRRVDVVQACNPPDLLFLVALPLVLLRRARFVFDHHDVSPEVLVAKGKSAHGPAVRLARVLERLTFGGAVTSIATNESFRDLAVRRGGMQPEDVFVVRSSPMRGFGAGVPDLRLKRGRRHLVGYVGVIGSQEGVNQLLDAASHVVHVLGRQDVSFAIAGNGPEVPRLKRRCTAMALDGHVAFLGWVDGPELSALLQTSDVCVSPDEVNAMNDVSTMNKVLEYMAFGRPIVQFDLHEGRDCAGSSSLYAAAGDSRSFAEAICRLLDEPALRQRMGRVGQARLQGRLAWEHQVPQLLAAYERALSKRPLDVPARRWSWWRAWSLAMTVDPKAVSREPDIVIEVAGGAVPVQGDRLAAR